MSILFILSISSGLLSLQTFLGEGIFKLNQSNVEILLFVNLFFLIILIISILSKIYNTYLKKQSEELGKETSRNLVLSFLLISSIPSILITVSSLFVFNYGIQNWFDNKILSLVNNSRNVAQNYLRDHQNSIVKDVKLIASDLNRNKKILLSNDDRFNQYIKFIANLRSVNNLYLIDGNGKLIKTNVSSNLFKPPLKKLLTKAKNGKPLIFSNAFEQKTLAILKLKNYDNLFIYAVQNVDPKIVSFLKQTGEASNYYYSVKKNTLRIQITFFIIYVVLTLALVLSSALFGINFATKTTKPLNRLFNSAKRVSIGKYDFVLGSDKNQDFNALNKVFDDMVSQMKIQKQKNILSGRFEAWQVIARKLAHEIKNPLTPIQLSLDRIKDKLNDENSLKHFTIINNQIHEISKLVNGFSDFARMPKPIFKKSNINTIINNSIDTYKLNYEKINFVLNDLSQTSEIICDSGQVSRVLINVYKNAVESIEEKWENNGSKGEIITNISNDKTYYLITIIDNGVGFKKAKNSQQDDPYFTTKKNGSGLGLSVVSKIIHEHNGQIFYDNRQDNDGAFITITLPILNEENINN